MNTDWKFKGVLLVLLLGIAFFIADCSGGRTGAVRARVSDHIYKPAYTQIWTSTNGDGHVQLHTTYYPEEWHVYCESLAGVEFDVNTSHRQYAELTNGQPVEVCFREGKWTHLKYLRSIVPINKLEK